MTLPLEGVRVLDLTQVYAGPTCTRILAELGADVVKVEGLSRPDTVRMLLATDRTLGTEPWHMGIYFSLRNASKRAITVELTKQEGRDLLARLIPHFDVLAESFTPRVLPSMGFDYESVKKLRQDIVMISMSGYGHEGPHSNWSAYGMGLEPASGISQMTGYPGGPPMRSGLSFTDPLAGMIAAGAVLTALHYRRRTGRGQYIDMSQHEAAIPLAAAAIFDFEMNGRPPERRGNRSPWFAPQGCYRCRGNDDWAVISCRDDAEWLALCEATGRPEWKSDARFETVAERMRNHDALDREIEAWTREQDKFEVMHRLQKGGVPAAAVLNGKEMLFDPQLRERNQFDVLDHPVQGKRPIPRNIAAKFSRFEAKPKSPAPLLGQHNHEVLTEIGLSEAEIAALESEGVIGNRPQLAMLMARPAPSPGDAPPPPPRAGVTWQDLLEAGALLAAEDDYKEQLGLAQ